MIKGRKAGPDEGRLLSCTKSTCLYLYKEGGQDIAHLLNAKVHILTCAAAESSVAVCIFTCACVFACTCVCARGLCGCRCFRCVHARLNHVKTMYAVAVCASVQAQYIYCTYICMHVCACAVACVHMHGFEMKEHTTHVWHSSYKAAAWTNAFDSAPSPFPVR